MICRSLILCLSNSTRLIISGRYAVKSEMFPLRSTPSSECAISKGLSIVVKQILSYPHHLFLDLPPPSQNNSQFINICRRFASIKIGWNAPPTFQPWDPHFEDLSRYRTTQNNTEEEAVEKSEFFCNCDPKWALASSAIKCVPRAAFCLWECMCMDYSMAIASLWENGFLIWMSVENWNTRETNTNRKCKSNLHRMTINWAFSRGPSSSRWHTLLVVSITLPLTSVINSNWLKRV